MRYFSLSTAIECYKTFLHCALSLYINPPPSDNLHKMASKDPQHEDQANADDELYLEDDDILAEVADDGDHPMDDDDDEGADQLGDLPAHDAEDDDDIVYEDNSIQHFPNHGQSVFAISTHPTANLAASGGEDDLGYVWDFTTGEEIVKLSGHSDSVTSTAFSSDGEMIATGGMDGKVRVWRRVGTADYKTWEFLTELQGPDEVMVRVFAIASLQTI